MVDVPKRGRGRPRKPKPENPEPKRPRGRPKLKRMSGSKRVIMVGEMGMDPPLDPAHIGEQGWRALRLINHRRFNITREKFLQAFERYNLCPGTKIWDEEKAKVEAARLWQEFARYDVVPPAVILILGDKAANAMGVRRGGYPVVRPFPYSIGKKTLVVRRLRDLSNFLISGGDALKMEIYSIILGDLYDYGVGNYS